MDIFNTFATNEALETEGVWRPLGGGAEIRVARVGNDRYTKLLSKLYAENQDALTVGGPEAEKLDNDLMLEVLATTVLVGWKRLTFKGQPLEYSVESAKLLLSVKDFRRLVEREAGKLESYRERLEVEEAKN